MKDLARMNMLGASAPFWAMIDLIRKFSKSVATVLIQGETGTGKELAARAIHYLSERRDQCFVPVNCGALSEGLIESELFGHVRGAFTDAKEPRPGLIAQARDGTLFLDEIEAMIPRAQVALLRFLQDKEYRPVGGTAVFNANTRVICATNTDLAALVNSGRFRGDLLFRLNVLPLHLPPLRERIGDVMILAQAFLDHLNAQSREPPKVFSTESVSILNAHTWPGNVRELENLIQREFVLASGACVIRITSLGDKSSSDTRLSHTASSEYSFKLAKAHAIAQFEKAYIIGLLTKTAGNISLAARLSGKDRSDICKLLRKYDLHRGQFTSAVDVSCGLEPW